MQSVALRAAASETPLGFVLAPEQPPPAEACVGPASIAAATAQTATARAPIRRVLAAARMSKLPPWRTASSHHVGAPGASLERSDRPWTSVQRRGPSSGPATAYA